MLSGLSGYAVRLFHGRVYTAVALLQMSERIRSELMQKNIFSACLNIGQNTGIPCRGYCSEQGKFLTSEKIIRKQKIKQCCIPVVLTVAEKQCFSPLYVQTILTFESMALRCWILFIIKIIIHGVKMPVCASFSDLKRIQKRDSNQNVVSADVFYNKV